MSEKYRLQKSGNAYHITVPAPLVRSKEWDKGTEVKWKVNDDGNLELKEK